MAWPSDLVVETDTGIERRQYKNRPISASARMCAVALVPVSLRGPEDHNMLEALQKRSEVGKRAVLEKKLLSE